MKLAFLFLFCILHLSTAQLRVGFYNKLSPRAEIIIQQVVQKRFRTDRSITAASLQMHFHDCFVRGCDASILIDSTRSTSLEKDAGPNLTVLGFELVDEAKKILKATCPTTVSCADVITLATYDAVALAGGPKYNVPTGRRDGLVSDSSEVNLPRPTLAVLDAIQFFTTKGLTLNDMVVLLGDHTVEVAQCGFFQDRLSNFQGTGRPNPTIDPKLAARLLRTCGTQSRPLNREPIAFLDQNTSFVFDNQFHNQIKSKKGIMQIDQELALDSLSSSLVSRLAANENLFRLSFPNTMVKMGNMEVLVGKRGEIRKNCGVFNRKRRA